MESPLQRADLLRRLENLVRLGTVAAVDYPAARARVDMGDLRTDWLPWLTARAGGDRSWWAPEVGEQVVVLSPSADPAQAVILPSLYRDSLPAPASSPDVHRVAYADGAVLQYDRAAHHLDVLLPGEATLRVVAVGGITIDAHGGDVVVHGDVIADGISLKDHVHSGVTRGGAYTDPPVGGGA